MLRKLYWRVRNKLLKRYRVELIDDETLSQSRQYLVKPISVGIMIGLALILVVGGTAALVIYTPIFHQLIPGYIDPEAYNQERAKMTMQLAQVEKQIENLQNYNISLQRLSGMNDSLPFDEGRATATRPTQGENFSRAFGQESSNNQTVTPEPAPTESAPTPVEAAPAATTQPRIPAVKTAYTSVLDHLFLPIEGTFRKGFSAQEKHYGVDIVAEKNTMIRSALDGFVIISEYSEDNGWVIGVSGQDNVVTFYKHNSRLLKQAGTYVRAGEAIAVIGNTGENTSGWHLHFELWQQGTPLNPSDYLAFPTQE